VCELVWVLREAYRCDRVTIASALDKISTTGLFTFGDREILRRALDQYRGGGGDYADSLISQRNLGAGCDSTVTFDRALEGTAGFRLL